MKAVKATYAKGKIRLSEKPTTSGPIDVLVVFPDGADDPWDAILNDPAPRPALAKRKKQLLKQIAQGKTTPLDLDQL